MAYRRALSLDPNVADSYLQLRHILKLQSKIEDAKAAYLRALALEPSVTFGLDELRALGWSAAETAELVAALRDDEEPDGDSTPRGGGLGLTARKAADNGATERWTRSRRASLSATL
jgi:tetratricopeptide (TPR) repeat protein